MARYLLAPFGSAGDVNPSVWLGRLLQSRGHKVTLITVSLFREMVEKAGLEFVGVGKDEEYLQALKHPDLWRPVAGTSVVFKMAMDALRPFYHELSIRAHQEDSVLVAPFHMFAARAVREKFRVPLVALHLQPACMLSGYDETRFIPGMEWLTRLPVWVKKLALKLPNPADRHVAKPLGKFCYELGIPAPRRVLPDWLHSPDGTLLLFPDWFAPRQPDWPANAVTAGFPLEDLRGQRTVSRDLEAFLNAGDKPVLFSPGTGNLQAQEFFAVGLAACEKLGCRALLGTAFPNQLPQPLPAFARHFDYLPFSGLLPRVCVHVHHGGIGTLSHTLAAGVPQLIMPMGHDQPDNALRARKLGVAVEVARSRFTVEHVSAALRRLMTDENVAASCRRAAGLVSEDRAAEKAVEMVEGVTINQ